MDDLVEGLKAGRTGAFERLVRDYGDRLYRFCLRIVGPADAEDVVQETFIRVHRSIGSYQPTGRFESWLFTIANHLALDALRRRPAAAREGEEPVDRRGPQDDLSHREVQDALLRAVERLPLEQKQVFLLREEAGMSFKEIAETTGCPLNTALGRMHYAMENLRKNLKAYQ
ncbi:MAG: sigma-70 family RNA polymerase sigma factor [Planctomycetes bacterium]|nr:sigma-70 family RNA polymerase sigma factor [Planctomycetota bacterium]